MITLSVPYNEVKALLLAASAIDRCEVVITGQPAPPPAPQRYVDTQVYEVLCAAGYKIAAIKLYRADHGTSLKDSKDAIEAIAARSRTVINAAHITKTAPYKNDSIHPNWPDIHF